MEDQALIKALIKALITIRRLQTVIHLAVERGGDVASTSLCSLSPLLAARGSDRDFGLSPDDATTVRIGGMINIKN